MGNEEKLKSILMEATKSFGLSSPRMISSWKGAKIPFTAITRPTSRCVMVNPSA